MDADLTDLLRRIEALETRDAQLEHRVDRQGINLSRLTGRVSSLEDELAALPPHTPHDPEEWVRRVLRRCWWQHHRGALRTLAARAIAVRWRTFDSFPPNEPPAAGTPDAIFALLRKHGVKPRAWRTIADDLDADLDGHR